VGEQSLAAARALPLLALILLVAPAAAAAICRSVPGVLGCALLAAIGITAQLALNEQRRWGIFACAVLAGCIVAYQAFRVRRIKSRLRSAKAELAKSAAEHADIREKYDREVHWRRAAEKLALPSPSSSQDGKRTG
jgi:hypothetical protein